MGTSTSRALFVLVLFLLGLLSLRPVGPAELAFDLLLAPVRVVGEVATPIGWLRAREVRAVEQSLVERREEEIEARQRLFDDGTRYAVPEPGPLTAGRRFVHAEVVDRPEDDFDSVVVAVESGTSEGLEVGMPVVAGEVYVGRVIEVPQPDDGTAIVGLVTGRDFFVGASVGADSELGGGPARLVVGGLVAPTRKRGDILLAVHNPSRRNLPAGQGAWVHVDESVSGRATYKAQAAGFVLGRLDVLESQISGLMTRLDYGVVPPIDFKFGLFQLAIVAPEGLARGPESPLPDALHDRRWRAVRATSSGDPTPWREGLKLGGGLFDGVRGGAAVIFGVRLVGRVAHAGALTSDVRLIGDPGFSVPAVARIEGREEPLALGRLVAIGPGAGEHSVLLQWDAVVKLPTEKTGGSAAGAAPEERSDIDELALPPVSARVFTGSGEPLVPRGLLIGDALLPHGPGPHRIEVQLSADLRRLRHLFVRLAAQDRAGPDLAGEGEAP